MSITSRLEDEHLVQADVHASSSRLLNRHITVARRVAASRDQAICNRGIGLLLAAHDSQVARRVAQIYLVAPEETPISIITIVHDSVADDIRRAYLYREPLCVVTTGDLQPKIERGASYG